jgi:hypothetical protein
MFSCGADSISHLCLDTSNNLVVFTFVQTLAYAGLNLELAISERAQNIIEEWDNQLRAPASGKNCFFTSIAFDIHRGHIFVCDPLLDNALNPRGQ